MDEQPHSSKGQTEALFADVGQRGQRGGQGPGQQQYAQSRLRPNAPDAPDSAGSRAEGRLASFLHEAMTHVQQLQIEIQNLKDALDASQKKANRYSQLGASGHCRSAIRTD